MSYIYSEFCLLSPEFLQNVSFAIKWPCIFKAALLGNSSGAAFFIIMTRAAPILICRSRVSQSGTHCVAALKCAESARFYFRAPILLVGLDGWRILSVPS